MSVCVSVYLRIFNCLFVYTSSCVVPVDVAVSLLHAAVAGQRFVPEAGRANSLSVCASVHLCVFVYRPRYRCIVAVDILASLLY